MFDNPLIQRYRCSLIRPKQFWVYQVVYLCIVGLILLISSLMYYNSQKSGHLFFNRTYYQFLTFQVLILWFWGSYNSGSAIRHEVVRKTYDFFKLLPLSAYEKALGILVGRNLVMLLFAAYNIVFLTIFGFFGDWNFRLQGQIFFVILSIALLTNALALLGSIRMDKKQVQTSATALVLLGLLLAPMALAAVTAVSESMMMKSFFPFYALRIPALIAIALIGLYFFCWCFIGIIRKFKSEKAPLFTYSGAMAFLVGYAVLGCGLFWPYLYGQEILALYFLWLILIIPVLLIPFGAITTYEIYLERFRTPNIRATSGKMIWKLFTNSNLFLCLSMFMIWALFSAGAGLSLHVPLFPFVHSIFDIFSFFLFLSLLFELYIVYQPLYAKIKLLLIFITLLYIVVPLILAAIPSAKGFVLYSPLGYVFYLMSKVSGGRKLDVTNMVFVLNLVFCILPVGLIWKRYIQICHTRQKISKGP